MNKLIKISLVLAFITIASCALPTWTRVESGVYVNEGNFSIVLPTGWLKIENIDKTGILVSIDGPALQSFTIKHENFDKAFGTTKTEVTTDTLSYELMEYYIAEYKAKAGNRVIEVESKEAAMISGKEGFRVGMWYKNQGGLRFKQVTYGCINGSEIYTLTYHAPVLYYFDKNVVEFEASVKTFLIL